MSESTTNTKTCTPERALFSLLTSYSKEDVDYSFTDVKRMFMEWLGTNHADETSKRESVAYSMEIIEHLESIVTAIPKKKIKALQKELDFHKANLVS